MNTYPLIVYLSRLNVNAMICAFSVKNLYCFNAYYLDFKYRAVDACFSSGYRAPMIFAALIGHTGKPTHPSDRGASYRHASGIEVREVDAVMRYAQALDGALLAAGHAALLLTDGTYRERSLRAKKREVSALLNCHVNAGLHGLPGQRSEIYYWPKSVKGLALANDLADALRAVVPWQDVRVTAAEIGPRLDETRAANVRACIDGAVTPSICVEPFFCDALDADQILSDGTLDRIGVALAQGLLTWGKR